MSKVKIVPITQTCKICSQDLPISSFSKHSGMKSGFLKICKSCANSEIREFRKSYKYKERISGYIQLQELFKSTHPLIICPQCQKELPISDFHKCNTSKSGIKRICKHCVKIKRDNYRKSDKYQDKIQKTILRRQNGKIGITHRTCTKCQQYLPITSFYKSNIVNSGYQSTCIRCKSINNIEHCQTKEYRDYSKKRRETEAYKEYIRQYQKRDDVREMVRLNSRRIRQTSKYREWLANYLKTDKHKQRELRYRKSDKCKAKYVRHTYKRKTLSDNLPSTLTAEEWEEIKKKYKYRCVYCGEKKPLTRDHIIPLSKKGAFVKENILPACRSCNSIKHTKPVLQQLLAMDKAKEPLYSA